MVGARVYGQGLHDRRITRYESVREKDDLHKRIYNMHKLFDYRKVGKDKSYEKFVPLYLQAVESDSI